MIFPEMRTVRMISTWFAIRIASVRMYLHISRSTTIRPKSGSFRTSRDSAILSSRSPMIFFSSSQPPMQQSGISHQAQEKKELIASRNSIDGGISRPISMKIFAKRGTNTVKSTTVTIIVTVRIASG